MSDDDLIGYPLLHHDTTLQTMYGCITVLPTTSNQMEAKLVFLEHCHKNQGTRIADTH